MSLKEERAAVADPKALAAERVLKRLGVGIKTFGLYPSQHPVAVQALETLLGTLRPYLATYGPLVVRISRHSLEVDGVSFGGESYAGLALHFYMRKVSMVTVLPPSTDQEVASFLSIAGMDRTSVESAGGLEHLLWQSSVGNIQVLEITLDEEQDVQVLGLNAFLALIGRGRLAPREREAVLDILFAADPTARLLDNVYLMTAEVFEGIDEDDRIDHVFQTVRTLDRLILDEPLEAQSLLYGSLTEALLLVEEPLRTSLPRTFAVRGTGDASAKFLLHQFSLDRLGELIARALTPEGVANQLAALLGALGLPERKNAALIALLETRLRPSGAPADWLSTQIRTRATGPGEGRSLEVPPEFVFDDALILIPQDAFAERIEEGRAITEAGAIPEVVTTLVDVLRDETDEKELPEVAEALAAHLGWIMEQHEFGLLAAVLARLKHVASGDDLRGRLAGGIVRKITEHPLLDRLLDALWAGRETPVEEQIRETLAVVAEEAVTPLVHVLGGEPRSGMRSLLCDLLVVIGRDHVGELAGFVGDERWYLVRNIANILGRLQHPDVVPHLERVVAHPEYRVRREVADALARVGTEAAQELLVRLLDDPDVRIQLRALQALNAWGARRAMTRLLALLEAPDPLQHLFANKVAAVEALERLRATEALPVLRRLARRPLAIGQHRRELRDLARRAVQVLEGKESRDVGSGERALSPHG